MTGEWCVFSGGVQEMFIEREVKAFTRGRPGESLGAAKKKHHKLAKKREILRRMTS